MNDTEYFDWLEKQNGVALLSDDFGHWVVVSAGWQNVPKKTPADIETTFFVKKVQWKNSIREAIDAARMDSSL